MVISIKNIHKSFKKNYVLKSVNLSINRGGIWAVLGPNASGKTTLRKTILGMVLLDEGQIFINGENVLGKWEYKKEINKPSLRNNYSTCCFCTFRIFNRN